MLNTTNTYQAAVLATLPAVTRAVIRVLKWKDHPEVADLASETICRLLSDAERFSGARSIEALAVTMAKNLAKDYCKRAENSHKHAPISGTDYDREDGGKSPATYGPAGDGVILAGPDGRATVERRADLEALEAAMSHLDADARTFVAALADGMTCKEAGALVGWSAPTATRRRKEIYADLRAQVG